MESSLDAKRLVYLPLWARIFCIVTLGVGLLLSSAVVIGYFGSSDNRDWVLIGLTSAQFMITTLVIAVVLFVSQTDATIGNLTKRTQQFLSVTLPDTLASIMMTESMLRTALRHPLEVRLDLRNRPGPQ